MTSAIYLWLWLFLTLLIGSTRSLAETKGWTSLIFGSDTNRVFSSPTGACRAALSAQGVTFVYLARVDPTREGVAFDDNTGFFCMGIDFSSANPNPGPYNSTSFLGDVSEFVDRSDHDWNHRIEVHEHPDLALSIRSVLEQFYGEQVYDWPVGSPFVELYVDFLETLGRDCQAMSYIPPLVGLPVRSYSALASYFVEYAAKMVHDTSLMLDHEVSVACAKSTALRFKTHFIAAGI